MRKPALSLHWRASLLGGVGASAVLLALLNQPRYGLPVPAQLNSIPFQVAIMSGERQAAQEAAQDAQTKVIEAPMEDPLALTAQSQDIASQLPDAVQAASEPNLMEQGAAQQDEVLPPAKISMPGGVLLSEDAAVAEKSGPDPLAIGKKQVYIRLFVNFEGKVMRGGIVRSGSDSFHDAILLKIVKSRIYQISNAMPSSVRDSAGNSTWQVDLVLDYDNESILP